VEEVRHHWLRDRFAFVIRRHRHGALEYLDRSSIPILHNIVEGSETGVDESTQIPANLFTSTPFRDAQPASRSFRKAVRPAPKVLSSVSFQKASRQSGGCVFVILNVVIFSPGALMSSLLRLVSGISCP
jgi:hypothetical protein